MGVKVKGGEKFPEEGRAGSKHLEDGIRLYATSFPFSLVVPSRKVFWDLSTAGFSPHLALSSDAVSEMPSLNIPLK